MAAWDNALGSLRAGQRARDKAGSDQALSKIVELNGKYRIFFRKFLVPDIDTGDPTEDADIRAAVVPGRVCDYDVCGTGFIPYNQEMLDYDPDTGEYKDLTNLTAWARIARVIFEASCSRDKKNAEAEAQRSATELGKPIDTYQLQKKLEDIDVKYHGGKNADGKDIMPSKQVAISGIKWKVSTRIAVVKLNAQSAPEWKDAKYATFEISKQKGDQLANFLGKPDYCFADTNYLELGYDYIGADKKAAGQTATFQGISRELSLENKFPDDWAKYGKAFIDGIIPDGDGKSIIGFLKARNMSIKNSADINSAINSFKKYCAQNAAIFGSIDFEDEMTAKAATDFLENHLLDGYDVVKTKMEELAEKTKKKDEDSEDNTAASTETSAPTETTAPVEGEGQSLQSIIDENKAEQQAMQTVVENANLDDAEQTIKNIAGGLGEAIGLDEDLADL